MTEVSILLLAVSQGPLSSTLGLCHVVPSIGALTLNTSDSRKDLVPLNGAPG